MKRAALTSIFFTGAVLIACGQKGGGAGLVPPVDAGIVATPAVDAGPTTVDINTCAGCALVAAPAWTFQGIFSDDKCTTPVAQLDVSACMPVPTLATAAITYNDPIGGRKANETAQNIALTGQIASDAVRYRKTDHGCVRANETATPITPANCAGQRICRDPSGALTCTNCRTITGGCPDLEETRMYASESDPEIKNAVAPGGNGNLEKLRQCCAALSSQAKSMGASPEAGMIASYAAQCLLLVQQAGPNGTAPELSALRSVMGNGNIPAVCKNL